MANRSDILSVFRGEISAETLRARAGLTAEGLQSELAAFLRGSLPPAKQRLTADTDGPIEIIRDRRGIPHIYAQTTADVYFGLGFAMAQDRLWQIEFFRRRGAGTLAEVLGPAYLASDIAHQTLDFQRIARSEAARLDPATGAIAGAFVDGINRAMTAGGSSPAIELAILDYEPAPWTIADVLVSLRGFWWSLNGRLQSIVAAEAASLLPPGPLRDAYLTPNLPEERILPPGSPHPRPGLGLRRAAGRTQKGHGSDDGLAGSNNWAVGNGRTASGSGILGSDPHQGFALPANWYECQLVTPTQSIAGAAWAGAPGVWFGRNRQIAWGLTNNGVSLRDLYVEDVDPDDPSRYRDGTTSRAFDRRQISIAVRGQPAHELEVLSTVRGPIVNHLIPSIQPMGDPALSLRWVGLEPLDDLKVMLAIGEARDWSEFRLALRDWSIPTFNFGFADTLGNVGYQCASRLPVRGRDVRGFREANNPDDRWQRYLPFEAQPSVFNPARAFTSSANNAPVPDDYPYLYAGAFAPGDRAIRVRELIETNSAFDRGACGAIQNDTLAVAARQLVPALLGRLNAAADPDVRLLRDHLATWDYHYELESTGPVCFEMFLRIWRSRIAAERFPAHLVGLACGQGSAFAWLLEDDDLDWFTGDKNQVIRECAGQAVAELSTHFGSDPAGWTWEKIHQLHLRHPLSTDATAATLDIGPVPISGGGSTVRNTGLGASPLFAADSGAEYRLIADLADPDRLWATQNIGQSGQPGSPFYADQVADFVAGKYHEMPLNRVAVEAEATSSAVIAPAHK